MEQPLAVIVSPKDRKIAGTWYLVLQSVVHTLDRSGSTRTAAVDHLRSVVAIVVHITCATDVGCCTTSRSCRIYVRFLSGNMLSYSKQ